MPTVELHVGQQFNLIEEARLTIHDDIIRYSESYKAQIYNTKVIYYTCRKVQENRYNFSVRITASKNGNSDTTIRTLRLYTCPLITHQNWRTSNSTQYLTRYYDNAILDDQTFKLCQIQAAKHLQYSNRVIYYQTYYARTLVRK